MTITLFKKSISLISIFSVLFCNLLSINVLAEVSCPDFNDDNQILDVDCAINLGREQIISGEKSYIKMDNIGENSEYTLYFFSPREISQILNKFKAPTDYNTFEQQEETIKSSQRENTNKFIEKVSTAKNGIASALRTVGLLGTGVVAFNNFDAIRNVFGNNFNARRGHDIKDLEGRVIRDNGLLGEGNFNQMQMRRNANLLLPKLIFLVPLIFADGILNLVGGVVSYFVKSNDEYDIEKNYGDRLNSYIVEKRNYNYVLERIVDKIKLNLFDVNNFLCLKLNKKTGSRNTEVLLFDNENAQFTDSEKIKFNKDIGTLKNNIENILARNNKED